MPDARHLLLQDTALRYFHEVAQCGSLTEASARLHVAASAINRRAWGEGLHHVLDVSEIAACFAIPKDCWGLIGSHH